MTTENYDWSRFTLRVNINNNAQTIYDAWSIPQNLEKYFLREACFFTTTGETHSHTRTVQQGNTYQWRWFGYCDDVTEKGEILTADGRNHLAFAFGLAGTVRIKIITENNYTLLELMQENIPVTEEGKINYHLGCTKGWTFFLTNLKSILEGGPDLRNKDENLTNVITA